MKREDILAMPAGRNLDSWVAEKVMGWTELSPIDPTKDWGVGVNGYRRNYGKNPYTENHEPLPLYHREISAAWEVVDKFDSWQVTKMGIGEHIGEYRVIIKRNGIVAYAKTAPEAICKASLLTLMEV